MQVDLDTKLESLLNALRENPSLDTGTGPLVLSAFSASWDVTYDSEQKRMVAEVKVAVTHEEG